MGLFSKRVKNKKDIPESIIFENFEEHRVENKLKVDSDCAKIERDMQKFRKMDFTKSFVGDFAEFNLNMLHLLQNSTESELFPQNLLSMINAVKWYAVHYFATDEGKTEQEVKNAILNLVDLYDIVVYIAMEHIMFEKGIYIKWENNEFLSEKDEYTSQFISMIIDVLNNIVKITDGIYDNNSYAVIEAYKKFCDTDIFEIKPDAEDIFDLN